MIKGVNKQVIEVVDTGSRYFERAILIVNPRTSGENVRIHDEAAKLFREGPKDRFLGRARHKKARLWLLIAAMGGFTGIGAAAMALILKLASG